MKIPMCDLKEQYLELRDEMIHTLDEVMTSSRVILGSHVKKLEADIAKLSNVSHGVGCANGSDAIHIALQAIGVTNGDEVITTAFTFFATGGAIVRLGAIPIFVDIDPVTYNIDPKKVELAITSKTKAIIPVHLYGQLADMDDLKKIANKYGLAIVEDAAQAIGATHKGQGVGKWGSMATYSFFPSKNLGAYGDGGMIVSNNEEIADKCRIIRVHGSRPKYYHHILGYNSRLDEMQAAILNVKLPHLAKWTKLRRKRAALYTKLIEQSLLKNLIITPVEKEGNYHVFHQYTIRVQKRDELQKYLKEWGIETTIYYPLPLHLQPVFQYLDYKEGDLPVTEQLAKEVISLPMFPEMKEEQQQYVIEKLIDFYVGY